MGSRIQWLLVILAMLLGLAAFAGRGLVRGWETSGDLVLIYSMTRAWVHGGNPYDLASCDRWWLSGGGPEQDRPSRHGLHTLLYPPTSFVFCLPIAGLSWSAAKGLWIASNCLFLAVSIICLGRAAGMKSREKTIWLLAAGAMSFPPVHTTIAHGQTALLALALLAAGIYSLEKQVNSAAGMFIASVTLLKPQIGLPYLAADILQCRWKNLVFSLITSVPIIAAGVLPMLVSGLPWWSSWQSNLGMFTVAGMGDPTRSNPSRYQLVNLHFLLHTFLDNPLAVNMLAAGIIAAIAGTFFLRLRSAGVRAGDCRLLIPSMIAVLTLLAFYHRFHDATLLLVPLAWCLISIRDFGAPRAYCILVLILPFFLNSASALAVATQNHRVPVWLASSWIWETLIMPHQVWALLGIAVCFVVESGRIR